MGNIHLSVGNHHNYTAISNLFIDSYMPSANGSYVKVYLYLLRRLSEPDRNISISGMADCFDNEEKDILRALKYWEKMKLLAISRDSGGEISDIQLIEPGENTKAAENIKAGENKFEKNKAEKQKSSPAAKIIPVMDNAETKVDFNSLSGNEELSLLLQVVETYLSRMLKPQDLDNISFFYNDLHFSPDLIEYLYDYCVSKGTKTSAYIKAVAKAWADEGVHTKEEAIASSVQYNELYNEIKRTFSLNRMLGDIEKKFADSWQNDYKSPLPLIREACNRSLLKTGKPDFVYADRILKNWSEGKITTLEQVALLDKAHKKSSAVMHDEKKTVPGPVPCREKPQNFKQRSYSKEEISSMEQNLLKKRLPTF